MPFNSRRFSSFRALAAFQDEAALSPFPPPAPLIDPSKTPTRKLSPTEKATVRIIVSDKLEMVDFGILSQASMRLWILAQRGDLDRMSGQQVAEFLRTMFWPAHPSRYAWRAWELMRAVDDANLVEIWIGSPDPDDPRRLRDVRLSKRLATIA